MTHTPRSIRDTRDRTYAFVLAYGIAVVLLELARHWPSDWEKSSFAFGLLLYPLGVACLLAIGRRARRILADPSLSLVALATVAFLAARGTTPLVAWAYSALAIGCALFWYCVQRPRWVIPRRSFAAGSPDRVAPVSRPHRRARGIASLERRGPRPSAASSRTPTRDPGYCLRCYAPLHDAGTRDVCDVCGFVNLAADRSIYWTREPKLVAIEVAIKAALGVFCVALSIGTVLTGGGTPAGGFALAAPVMITAILWPTVSKITQHVSYLNARVFWTIAFAMLSIPGVAGLSLVPVFAPILYAFFGEVRIENETEWVLVGGSAIVSFGLLLATVFGAPHLRRWKQARIESGGWQSARRAASGGSPPGGAAA